MSETLSSYRWKRRHESKLFGQRQEKSKLIPKSFTDYDMKFLQNESLQSETCRNTHDNGVPHLLNLGAYQGRKRARCDSIAMRKNKIANFHKQDSTNTNFVLPSPFFPKRKVLFVGRQHCRGKKKLKRFFQRHHIFTVNDCLIRSLPHIAYIIILILYKLLKVRSCSSNI